MSGKSRPAFSTAMGKAKETVTDGGEVRFEQDIENYAKEIDFPRTWNEFQVSKIMCFVE